MSKEIIVREAHIIKAFRKPTLVFTVLMKDFIKTEIKAFMDAEDIFRITSENSEIRLIFQSQDIKVSFFTQLNLTDSALFEKLEKKQIFVQI